MTETRSGSLCCPRNLPWCDCTALERERDVACNEAEEDKADLPLPWEAKP
jgi:hypothetical protein